MTFNLETWKEKAGGRLREMGAWLGRRKAQDAPYLLYGALCGASLWPLVEAVQAGQTLPAVMALGSVAAGVGGNLLAEQVQRWKNEADEAALAGWVAEHAPSDPDLRQALDAVLEELEAVAQAQAALSEADRAWFTATLRGELAQLGNLARFEATLTGSGVIAQDHSVAATTGGVAVGGDVGGDVVTGTKVTGTDARGQTIGTQIHVSGDYYAERQSPAAPARAASDEPGWNRAAIGDLLNAAFNEGELDDLCFYHFEPVRQNFGAGMDKRTRIRALLDYCFRQGQVEDLLALIREHNAFQYARFEGRLKD
jgi:hypothetical protein